MNITSNTTAEEEYRLTGSVTGIRLEQLLDDSLRLSKILNAEDYIQEATSSFPNEDFLSSITESLYSISKNVRGTNKDDILRVIESLTDLEISVTNDSEYGREQLYQAMKAINGSSYN